MKGETLEDQVTLSAITELLRDDTCVIPPYEATRKCTRGHTWTEPGYLKTGWVGKNGEHYCPRCFEELLARECGKVIE